MRKIKEKLLEEVKQTDRSLIVRVFIANNIILTNRNNNPMHNNPMYNKHSKAMLNDSARVVLEYQDYSIEDLTQPPNSTAGELKVL